MAARSRFAALLAFTTSPSPAARANMERSFMTAIVAQLRRVSTQDHGSFFSGCSY